MLFSTTFVFNQAIQSHLTGKVKKIIECLKNEHILENAINSILGSLFNTKTNQEDKIFTLPNRDENNWLFNNEECLINRFKIYRLYRKVHKF